MTARRPDAPVSWLLLEQYALGTLDDDQAARVAAAIAADAETRACLELIHADRPPLPPLEVPAAPRRPSLTTWLRGTRRRWRAGLALASAAVAVAALLLLVLRDRHGAVPGFPDRRIGIKGGGELALGLVRDRAGAIDSEPTRFAASDRFKVVVTCAPASLLRAELVVYQDGAASFPLPPIAIDCGNRVVVPGAFRIDGKTRAAVCLAIGDQHPPDRAELSRHGLSTADRAACITLTP